MLLDDIRTTLALDRSGMLKLLESFPRQILDSADIGIEFKLPAVFKHISYSNVICAGMGGSAIGADLVRAYLSDKLKVPFLVSRDYLLPAFVNRETLVIVLSYSGNTEETLSAYRDARSKKAKIIAVTSGGALGEAAERDGAPVIYIPEGLPPRTALPYLFFPVLIAISRLGLVQVDFGAIRKTAKLLERLQKTCIGASVSEKDNTAKSVAAKLHRRYPVIYANQSGFDSVALRWRSQLAENSKALASSNLFPELDHNEIAGWKNPAHLLKNFGVVVLRDKADGARISKRMDITLDILRKLNIEILEINSVGDSLLERVFSLIYTGDFVSFYLALLYGEDPTSIDRITYLKKRLAGKRKEGAG